MRGRPPKKTLTPEQERAASAFVGAAEAPTSGSGRAGADAPGAPQPPAPLAAGDETASAEAARVPGHRRPGPERPWQDDRVRADVVKGYALRLPEPLYLKLKWVAEQTGRSMNAVCRDAVETEVQAFLDRS